MSKQLYEKENNINKPFFPVVRLEDIIDTISEKSIQWILNNYNHIYVEWKNDVVGTRLSVPTILRRNGLWITYNNGDRLITEYYIGKNTEIKDKHWQDDTNWEDYTNKLIDGTVEYRHLSESLKQLFNKGNVTNFPDEEDLTSDGVALSFKDREYQPENFSGLGRVIIRKNIIKVGEEYKNILTQNMINKDNTIYIIRYDFDLNGQDIILPDNSYIEYEGGSISYGNIIDRAGGFNRIVLKKNIINGKNVLTQEMISKSNSIYEIRYDFDLNSAGITIPERCILDFQGGSLNNGSVIGKNTNILAGSIKIFGNDILVLGKWNIEYILPEWFGAKVNGDNYALNTIAINNAIQFAINCRNGENSNFTRIEKAIPIKFNYGKYIINDRLHLSSTTTVLAHASGTTIEQINEEKPIFVVDKDSYLWGSSGSGAFITYIEGFTFIGGKRQIILESSNIGGRHDIISCNFINPNPDDYCIYVDAVSSVLNISNCRAIHVTNFLYTKTDHASIKSLEASVYNINGGLVEEGCFITNKSRMLEIDSVLATVGDGSINTPTLNYRFIDNYSYVKINGFVLDGPGGGVPLVYNYVKHIYGDWYNWYNNNDAPSLPPSSLYSSFASAVIIENSTLPVGGANKALIVLVDGVPAITSIRNCNMIDGPFIKAIDSFNLSQYLTKTLGLGTITINISNNNNSNISYTLVPDELMKYTIIETSNNWSSPKIFLPHINTDLLEGIVCKTNIDSNNIIYFDIPTNVYKLSSVAVSIGYTSSSSLLNPRESIFGILNFASDGNKTVYCSFKEINRMNVITADNPVEVELVSVRDNVEYAINAGVPQNGKLRIKLKNLNTNKSYLSHCRCNILPLFLNL